MEESCYVEPIDKITNAGEIKKADNALLLVRGMGCQNCVTRVRNSLLSLDGVHAVEVFLNIMIAEVSYDNRKVSGEMLVEAVSRAGNDGRHNYRAELIAA